MNKEEPLPDDLNCFGGLIPAPNDRGQWSAWRGMLHDWRARVRTQLAYDDTPYRQPEYAWGRSCFALYDIMAFDQEFIDPVSGQMMIERVLDRGERELGGFDAILIWPAYPRIGIDDRNQFDYYRELPGGLAALHEVSARCHARGVKVFVAFIPWDADTRRESQSEIDADCELVHAIDADGVYLDTMPGVHEAFRSRLDTLRPGVILEPENRLELSGLPRHHMSFAQKFPDSDAPGVLRNKWFERRHMQHQINRWLPDQTGELHIAWMNGSGLFVWDNIFSLPNLYSPRDRSIMQAMLPIQRRYVRHFSGEGWTPLVDTATPHVYASLWEADGLRLWTIVNRSEEPVAGVLLTVPHVTGDHYYDLIAGHSVAADASDSMALTGTIQPRGIGAFVAGSIASLGHDFTDFLIRQAALAAGANFNPATPVLTQNLKPVGRTHPYTSVPAKMVTIAGTTFELEVTFRIRESGLYDAAETKNQSYEFVDLHKPAKLTRPVTLQPYAIDRTPVTNEEFSAFLEATGYTPKQPQNFLKHWIDGSPPPEKREHPVVFVDLDDARAFAQWAGKRLPTEEEWQYAAEGPQHLRYPWGDTLAEGMCNDGTSGDTTAVTAFPAGRSPFGCYDMCGNVWELTESERDDGRTRFCILKGGSFYQATASYWYFDGGPQPCSFAAKFIRIWPGLDRCGTVGFRCVVDLNIP